MGSQEVIYPMCLSQSVNRLAKEWNIEGRLIAGTEILLFTITARQLAYKVYLVGSEKHFSENMTVRAWSWPLIHSSFEVKSVTSIHTKRSHVVLLGTELSGAAGIFLFHIRFEWVLSGLPFSISYCSLYFKENPANETNLVHNILSIFRQFYL